MPPLTNEEVEVKDVGDDVLDDEVVLADEVVLDGILYPAAV